MLRNSTYLRYLDLTLHRAYKPRTLLKFNQLQLNCTRLQELRLSEAVGISWATQLIQVYPGIRLLHWIRPYSRALPTSPSDLKPLLPLRQLRSLQLISWKLNAVSLYRVLDNNADSLEDLDFGSTTTLLDEPRMNDEWGGLTETSLTEMTRKEVADVTKWIQGRPLLLPKLKKLWMRQSWSESSDAVCSLVCAFPSLEFFSIGTITTELVSKLPKNLQEFCPNLRSIHDATYCSGNMAQGSHDVIIYVIDAFTSGTLAHIEPHRISFSTDLANALLKHQDGPETLEIKFINQRPAKALRNVRKVLDGCCDRLKKFSLADSNADIDHDDSDNNTESEDEEVNVGVDTEEVPVCEDDTTPTVFQLPSGWRQTELAPCVYYLESSILSDAFMNVDFEAVADLPYLQATSPSEAPKKATTEQSGYFVPRTSSPPYPSIASSTKLSPLSSGLSVPTRTTHPKNTSTLTISKEDCVGSIQLQRTFSGTIVFICVFSTFLRATHIVSTGLLVLVFRNSLLEEVNATIAGRLIQANPGLRRLRWKRHFGYGPEDLRVVFPLRQLRFLGLMSWRIHPVYLYHILNNNADCLEELELGGWSTVQDSPHMNECWDSLVAPTLSILKEEDQSQVADLIQGRPLLLPKAKTLHLLINWADSARTSVCTLVRAFPAPETLRIGVVDNELGMQLGKNLREFYPNLRSILNTNKAFEGGCVPSPGHDGLAYIVQACKPGNLAHLELNRWEIEAKLVDALVEQGDGLEIMNVHLCDFQTAIQSYRNMCRVFERYTVAYSRSSRCTTKAA
ncbi:MAG: hypothetical protein J3R72DRAFT_492349 [Linnemannia gamsii]|nr:MAG: hypothetical protein J3R72DRAFT_492349 [Linnemannia gamsii]